MIIMNGLTIAQAQKYAGYSHPTWLNWLKSGIVKGDKGNARTDTWFIPYEEVERIRLKAITELQEKIDSISTSVPVG